MPLIVDTIILLFASIAMLAVLTWTDGTSVTPDGAIYLAAGRGERVSRPFNRRPLWPFLLRDNIASWTITAYISTILTPPLLGIYLGSVGMDRWGRLLGGLLIMSLPGSFRLLARWPVLVDAPSNFLALLCAVLELRGHHVLAALVSIVSCTSKEHTPILASLFSGSFIPLIGYLGSAFWFLRKPLPNVTGTRVYFIEAVMGHRERQSGGALVDIQIMLLPWGVVSFMYAWGIWNAPAWQVICSILALLFCYAIVLVVWERSRVFTWAAPIVIAVALQSGFSLGLLLALLLVHTFNPWARQS